MKYKDSARSFWEMEFKKFILVQKSFEIHTYFFMKCIFCDLVENFLY